MVFNNYNNSELKHLLGQVAGLVANADLLGIHAALISASYVLLLEIIAGPSYEELLH